jgi:hypothetical protein
LFREFSEALPSYVGMPWDVFEAITHFQLFDASFDGSYIALRLHLLHGELNFAGVLPEGTLKRSPGPGVRSDNRTKFT